MLWQQGHAGVATNGLIRLIFHIDIEDPAILRVLKSSAHRGEAVMQDVLPEPLFAISVQAIGDIPSRIVLEVAYFDGGLMQAKRLAIAHAFPAPALDVRDGRARRRDEFSSLVAVGRHKIDNTDDWLGAHRVATAF
ncbi:MAG TPA: hypothetical protein VFR68_06520 [Candidatus Dormibacteraeota bacterium]|nr:hypothetical protein [Candidatus Dormibacteraeota bacterium]